MKYLEQSNPRVLRINSGTQLRVTEKNGKDKDEIIEVLAVSGRGS